MGNEGFLNLEGVPPGEFLNADDEQLWKEFEASGWTQLPSAYVKGLHRFLAESDGTKEAGFTEDRFVDETGDFFALDTSLDYEDLDLADLQSRFELRWLWEQEPLAKSSSQAMAREIDEEADLATLCIEFKILLSILRRAVKWRKDRQSEIRRQEREERAQARQRLHGLSGAAL